MCFTGGKGGQGVKGGVSLKCLLCIMHAHSISHLCCELSNYLVVSSAFTMLRYCLCFHLLSARMLKTLGKEKKYIIINNTHIYIYVYLWPHSSNCLHTFEKTTPIFGFIKPSYYGIALLGEPIGHEELV